ncbi:MAG: hypothetical protein ACRDX9_12035 [Acidimicrobiia bacterium]
MFSIVMVAWGPPAFGAHIPATGPLPSNCVEFQVNTTGSKSPAGFPGIDITVTSWDNGSESHQVSFSISGLAAGQYVDVSAKSGTTVQETGPYGNGAHSFTNGLQNAISHVRLCVFGEPTTTTTVETTTTLGETTTTTGGTTTTSVETTTTVGETTTTTGGTTTTVGETPTTVAETTTTVLDPTTTDATTTTVDDEVLGTVVTTTTPGTSGSEAAPSTVADEVLGTTIVPGDLPFTGMEGETIGQLALALIAAGVLTLTAVRVIRGRARDQA